MRPLLALALVLHALAPACNSSPAIMNAPADLAPAPPDLACTPAACTVEKNEDCDGCFRHIGECCYADPNWKTTPATFNGLVLACNDIPRCAACCNECKQLSCAEIVKRGNCPFGAP